MRGGLLGFSQRRHNDDRDSDFLYIIRSGVTIADRRPLRTKRRGQWYGTYHSCRSSGNFSANMHLGDTNIGGWSGMVPYPTKIG